MKEVPGTVVTIVNCISKSIVERFRTVRFERYLKKPLFARVQWTDLWTVFEIAKITAL
jgi:hypothetical protein